MMASAIAAILTATVLGTMTANPAFAKGNIGCGVADCTATGGYGGIGGAGGAAGVGGNGGTSNANNNYFAIVHSKANGGDADGGNGGDANGGDAANGVTQFSQNRR